MYAHNCVDTFNDEEGDEYKGSKFGGFPEYFRRKKIKLQNLDAELRSHSGEKPPIFRGIVTHVNGYTQPSLNDLHKLIVSHGGGFMQYLDGKTTVTHIIASNLTPKKAVEFKRYRIVKPAWVVDSVEAGKLLPWDAYRVVDEGVGQKVLGFDKGKVITQANTQVRSYKDQTDNSWYTNQLKAANSTSYSSQFAKPSHQHQQPPTPEVQDEIEDRPLPNQAREDETNEGNAQSEQPTKLPVSPYSSPTQIRDGPAVGATVTEDLEAVRATESEELPAANHGEYTDAEVTARAESEPDRQPRGLQPEDLRPDDLGLGYGHSDSEARGLKRSGSDMEAEAAKLAKMTAEDHNRVLLEDPRIRKSTVVNPEFLEQYYRESRLHHLSAWKAELKSQMQALTAEKSASQKQRQKRPAGSRRYVMHVDFDSFFAAVSLKKQPEFVDKPAVVAHGNGSGSEIASCNYPARKFGVKNGMWMKRALDLCPDLKILPYDFPAYEEASRAFYEAIIVTGGIVQSVSVDEALVDITDICIPAGGTDGKRLSEGAQYREQEKADELGKTLREDIKNRTGCNVSVGIGGNILLAKVALRKAKPAGQHQIKPEEVLDFIGKLEVQDLPGVAYSIGGKLEDIGIKYVKDIREFSREKLINTLGPKTGEKIWEYSRGIDKSEVGDVVIRKSVSAEVNWGVRFVTQDQVNEFMLSLCGELSRRLLKEGVKGRQLTMKIMRRAMDAPLDPPKHLGHGKCDTFNKSIQLGVATNAPEVLTRETLSILKSFGFSPGELRGIGVQMTKLEPLKPAGQVESSQRRLYFKTSEPKQEKPPTKEPDDPIQDDVVTPKRSEKVSFGPSALNQTTPRKKPLNTLGTQFVLPTQVDPKVLAELPDDIRAKLAQHLGKVEVRPSSPSPSTTPTKPKIPNSIHRLPNQSQLDMETLNALPEDVRAEIMAFYNQSPSKRAARANQSILPQSPRKNRSIATSKRLVPTVSKRGRPSKAAIAARGRDTSTLTQANFVFAPQRLRTGTTPVTDSETEEVPAEGDVVATTEEVDSEVLNALPTDVRAEVLDEQRRNRLASKSNLSFEPIRKRPAIANLSTTTDEDPEEGTIIKFLSLLPQQPKPTFTTRKLSALPELREAMSSWVGEFNEEGPYPEDIEALSTYLQKVVEEERNMNKAVSLVKWLGWRLDQDVGMSRDITGKWRDALETVRGVVQAAVRKRGAGEVDFDA